MQLEDAVCREAAAAEQVLHLAVAQFVLTVAHLYRVQQLDNNMSALCCNNQTNPLQIYSLPDVAYPGRTGLAVVGKMSTHSCLPSSVICC